MFAEAIVLPWDLFLAGKDEATYPGKVSSNQLNEAIEHHSGGNYQECLPNKKCKTVRAPIQALLSGLIDEHSSGDGELSTCSTSSSFRESTEWKCGNLSSLEIPCVATIRSANSHNLVSLGKLCCTKCKVRIGSDCKPSAEKLLLEFSSENFFKYQVCQILLSFAFFFFFHFSILLVLVWCREDEILLYLI